MCFPDGDFGKHGKTDLSEVFDLLYRLVANYIVEGHRERVFATYVGCELIGVRNNA